MYFKTVRNSDERVGHLPRCEVCIVAVFCCLTHLSSTSCSNAFRVRNDHQKQTDCFTGWSGFEYDQLVADENLQTSTSRVASSTRVASSRRNRSATPRSTSRKILYLVESKGAYLSWAQVNTIADWMKIGLGTNERPLLSI